MDNGLTGKIGEDFAAEYFIKSGWKILDRNFHSRYGEIDLIVENEKYILFVEVKSRGEKSISRPCEAVTLSKQKKIIFTAQTYLMNSVSFKQPRFDVFEVWIHNKSVFKFNHIENAFDESSFDY